jgi:hypothetical protein
MAGRDFPQQFWKIILVGGGQSLSTRIGATMKSQVGSVAIALAIAVPLVLAAAPAKSPDGADGYRYYT